MMGVAATLGLISILWLLDLLLAVPQCSGPPNPTLRGKTDCGAGCVGPPALGVRGAVRGAGGLQPAVVSSV